MTTEQLQTILYERMAAEQQMLFLNSRLLQIMCKPPKWCKIEAPQRRLYIWPEKIGYSCAGVPLFRRNGYRQSSGRKPLFRNRDTALN